MNQARAGRYALLNQQALQRPLQGNLAQIQYQNHILTSVTKRKRGCHEEDHQRTG
jgi:hypothetical protein